MMAQNGKLWIISSSPQIDTVPHNMEALKKKDNSNLCWALREGQINNKQYFLLNIPNIS